MPEKILNDVDLGENVFAKGVINAADDEIIVNIGGAASARLSFNGIFTGVLEVTGYDDTLTKVRGGRLLFLSGYGSRGAFTIEGKGDLLKVEGAVCCGSRFLSIRPIAWTGGSIEVGVFAGKQPFITFINGSVNTPEEEAARSCRAFVAGLNNFPVDINEKLDFSLENPASNNHNLFLTERLFGHDIDIVLKYVAYNGTIIDLANTGTIANRKVGSPNASNAIFKYEKRAATAPDVGTTVTSGEPIAPYAIRERKLLEILHPGTKIAFSINGSGVNISKAVGIYATLQWYEEPAI